MYSSEKTYKTLMSVKNDFVFKLIFGDEKHKNLLAAFLSSVMKLSKSEFYNIEIMNTELYREFN